MSRWTHVAGLVRIDSLHPSWQPMVDARLARGLPFGSEGPVQYQVVSARSSSSGITAGYVSIWGDLRDFGDADDIECVVQWLDESLRYEDWQPWFVRQGVVQIEDEHGENSLTWHYVPGEEQT